MIFDLLNTLAAALAVGLFLALAFIAPERAGALTDNSLKIRRTLRFVLALWSIASIGNCLSTLASLFDTSITQILDSKTILSYLTQTSIGRLQLIQCLTAFVLLPAINLIKRNGGAVGALLIAIIGATAPLLESHASQAASHSLAIGSIIVHVIAISFWIGAVASLLLIDSGLRHLVIARVSTISTWSLVTIIATGVVNSLLHLGISGQWLTSYGALIALKIFLLVLILWFAQRIRSAQNSKNAIRIEVSLLLLVISIGALLSRFTPQVVSDLPFDRTRELVGITMPAEPNLRRVLFEYEAEGLILAGLILATALYIRGVVTLSRRGVKWPVGRTLSFAIGISLLDYATSGGVGLYSIFSFQYHMIAHMIISMIAPIAIVLSAPITLALRTLPLGRDEQERGIRHWFLALIHSRLSMLLTHPVVALAIFDGSLFALYFTPIFGDLMSSHIGHLFMNFHFIAVGMLFFYVVIGIDPNPRRVHHLVRIVVLLAAMSIHAFFSISLMSSSALIDGGYYESLARSWAIDLLADQRLGAAIGWAMGEIPIVIALIAVFIQWVRSDAREAKRADKDGSSLADYNDYLRRLANNERDS